MLLSTRIARSTTSKSGKERSLVTTALSTVIPRPEEQRSHSTPSDTQCATSTNHSKRPVTTPWSESRSALSIENSRRPWSSRLGMELLIPSEVLHSTLNGFK